MLSTHPQSIMSMFSSSFDAYKKVLIPMLPISFLSVITQVILRAVGSFNTGRPWVVLTIAIVAVFFSMFCFYWALRFVYDILTEAGTNYQATFSITIRRLYKVLALPIVFNLIGVAGVYLLLIYGGKSYLMNVSNSAVVFFFWVMTFLLSCYVFTFSMVYTLDILIANSEILPAIKKSAQVMLGSKGMMRIFIFIVLCMLAGFISLALVFVLSLIGIILKPAVSEVVILILAVLFLLPFNSVIFINFCHDLRLRSEGNVS
jgi:hypothetical protein